MERRTIKMGVFGGCRGSHFYNIIRENGGEIVAVCDFNQAMIDKAIEGIEGNVTGYLNFDEFIEHEGLEAIMVSNYFHEHTPYAIRALEKGIHVLSECTSNGTLAEGVAIVRAAEKSSAIYMLAENYPFMLFNQEMKRIYEGGTLGRAIFCEGEYNHPLNPSNHRESANLCPTSKHWRYHLPRTYYVTHALAPLMYITGATPTRVTAVAAYGIERDPVNGISRGVPEKAAIITCINDDGSVYRVTGCAAWGAHEKSYRICAERGQMENLRNGTEDVLLSYNNWDNPNPEEPAHRIYTPVLQASEEEKASIERAGHGGGDYYVIKEFFDCIREGRKPCFDVYFATTMASVAILGHRSLLEGGMPYDIPDFRREEDRVRYENDTLSPFYGADGSEPTIAATPTPDYFQTSEGMAAWDAFVEEVRNGQS